MPTSGSKAAATEPAPVKATRPGESPRSLYFTTADSRYSWLDGALALWEGEFNEVTHRARYTAFIQPTAPAI